MSRSTVAVLAYHRVGPQPPGSWETWFSVSTEVFCSQLASLDAHGWEVIDSTTFVAGLDDPRRLPPRSALLTFDDGYRTLLGAAREHLGRLGYPGVMFVPTGFVGESSRWDEETDQPVEAVCDWDELRALELSGISVQSHGVRHRAFSDLCPAEIETELAVSKAALEHRLDKSVELFAFPYGDAGADPAAVGAATARAGYRAGFLYDGGPVQLPVDDCFRLARIPIGSDTNLELELGALAG